MHHKKGHHKKGTGPFIVGPPDGNGSHTLYWSETRRPFSNLVFVLPILLCYEFGVFLVGQSRGESIRNGVDAWLRWWLGFWQFQPVWLPPILLVSIFTIGHLTTRQRWRVTWDTLAGMAAESLLFAFVLILIGQLSDFGYRQTVHLGLQIENASMGTGIPVRLLTFMGAGIYEEFVFRLCLIPVVYTIFSAVMLPKRAAIALTAITTSLVFALAHYFGPSTDGQILQLLIDAIARVQASRELWFGFVFRTLAGIFFSTLYLFRGFGITVGTHTAYDFVVGMVLISEL